MFKGLDSLKQILLYKSNLSVISNGIFDGLNNMYHISLSYNPIVRLESNAFAGLNSLKVLHLIELDWELQIEDGCFSPLENLRLLDLSGNFGVSNLKADAFVGLKSLITLNLSRCHLTSIHNDWFSGLGKLEQINLRGNHLECLDLSVLSSLTKLKKLILDQDQVTGNMGKRVSQEDFKKLIRFEVSFSAEVEFTDDMFAERIDGH